MHVNALLGPSAALLAESSSEDTDAEGAAAGDMPAVDQSASDSDSSASDASDDLQSDVSSSGDDVATSADDTSSSSVDEDGLPAEQVAHAGQSSSDSSDEDE